MCSGKPCIITELERRFVQVQQEWEEARQENAAAIARNMSMRRDLESERTAAICGVIEALIGPDGRHLRAFAPLAAELESLSLCYQETLPILTQDEN